MRKTGMFHSRGTNLRRKQPWRFVMNGHSWWSRIRQLLCPNLGNCSLFRVPAFVLALALPVIPTHGGTGQISSNEMLANLLIDHAFLDMIGEYQHAIAKSLQPRMIYLHNNESNLINLTDEIVKYRNNESNQNYNLCKTELCANIANVHIYVIFDESLPSVVRDINDKHGSYFQDSSIVDILLSRFQSIQPNQQFCYTINIITNTD